MVLACRTVAEIDCRVPCVREGISSNHVSPYRLLCALLRQLNSHAPGERRPLHFCVISPSLTLEMRRRLNACAYIKLPDRQGVVAMRRMKWQSLRKLSSRNGYPIMPKKADGTVKLAALSIIFALPCARVAWQKPKSMKVYPSAKLKVYVVSVSSNAPASMAGSRICHHRRLIAPRRTGVLGMPRSAKLV